MNKIKILYITQELEPYTDFSEMAEYIRNLILNANKKSFELRVLMPKFGTINERRHKLHEVVRLSGMNIIIDDDDFPLIIKVASLPESRIQVYFLDNDEFFKRKMAFTDDEGKPFQDNDGRMIFFCKGAIETVKKFGWPPDIIHANGWMTSLIPLFLKKVYANDPVYQHSKIVYTPFEEHFGNFLSDDFRQKVLINNMSEEDISDYIDESGMFNLDFGAIRNSDAIVLPKEEKYNDVVNFMNDNEIPFYIHKVEELNDKGELSFYKKLLKEKNIHI